LILDRKKLIWIDEKNSTIEVSENVTKYLNLKKSAESENEFLIVRISEIGISTRYEDKKGKFFYGCRFFCENCKTNDNADDGGNTNITCNFFYSGDKCEKCKYFKSNLI
jgi:hypothetical protein